MKKMSVKLVVALASLVCVSSMPLFAKETVIKILHTNDTHARVEDDGKSIIGFAKLAGYVQEEKKEGNLLVLDAGDMFQGLPFANLAQGKSIIDIANAVGYDAMTLGNHEFDYGTPNILEIISKLNYPVIASNFTKDEENVVDSYIVKEFDGVKVGIFGMATEETAFKSHPKNTEGYKFEDMIQAAQENVQLLKDKEKVDVVIMLAHLGLDEGDYTSDLVAKQVEGIDLIIDGHSHTKLENGRQVGNTLIVSTGEYFSNVGEVELVVDPDEDKVSVKASLLGYEDFADVTPDQTVLDAIEAVKLEQNALLSQVVGKTEVRLVGDREQVRTGETNLGQLAAAAIEDLTGADMVITNGGGIRASIEAGDITMNDLVTVFPFGNTIMVKEIKGSDIKAALELGVSEYPNQKGAFPHTAGITYTLNAYKEAGNRVSDIVIGGKALDLNKTYTVATNDFVASGGDGYEMFASYPVKAEYNTLMDTLLDYIKEKQTIEGGLVPSITIVTEAPSVSSPVKLRAALEEHGFKVVYEMKSKQIKATKADVEICMGLNQAACTVTKADGVKTIEVVLSVEKGVSFINSADLNRLLAA